MPIDWEWVALGVDAALSLMFYTMWRKGSVAADLAEQVEQVYIGPDLEQRLKEAPGYTLPYVCIEGVTEAIGTPLRSMYQPESERGVIQVISLIEHRSRRIQGHWSDSKRTIHDATNIIPFQLRALPCQEGRQPGEAPLTGDQSKPVQVVDALSAEYILDDLRVTHNRFEPSRSTAIEKGVDRLFGDVAKGVQEKEQMLGVGVHLLGIGRVVLDRYDGRIRIMPPLEGERYILTTLTKSQAVRILRSRARLLRGLFVLCTGIGVGLLVWWGVRNFKKWKLERDMRRAVEDFRSGSAASGEEAPASGDQCIVCLSNNPRVVLLNCGHICLCRECAMNLPEPKVCPVCRSSIERIQPIYIT